MKHFISTSFVAPLRSDVSSSAEMRIEEDEEDRDVALGLPIGL